MSTILKTVLRKLNLVNHSTRSLSIEMIENRDNPNLNVRVSQGSVVGIEDVLPNGKPLYCFKGIPYAHPPIGKLRFQAPLPLDTFPGDDLWDATKEGDVSFQKDPFHGAIAGSEDCLYLNVYTPVSSEYRNDANLSVMIWLHGGAFLSGSGNADYYSPEYLVQEGVIVVTCNYRLGAFGFLCLPEAGIQGNAGLKDQLQVLRWVNRNIDKFGGNAKNVTLFGESVGGASVHLHLLSKNSRQYFHRAICQSGTAPMEWVIQKNPIEKSTKLAQRLGCKNATDQRDAFEYLLNFEDAEKMLAEMINTITPEEKRRGLPMIFKPCIEEDLPGAFLTKPLTHSLMNGRDPFDIPLMIGYNSADGLIMVREFYKNLHKYEEDLGKMIPRTLDVHPDSAEGQRFTEEIRKFYFKNGEINKKMLEELAALHTDYHFGIISWLTAELHVRTQPKSKLYFYRFDYDGDYNFYKTIILAVTGLPYDQFEGACHADDLHYLFNPKSLRVLRRPTESQRMMKTMCLLWTNFAKCGEPTPDDSLPFKWEPVKGVSHSTDELKINYLEIGNGPIEMRSEPDADRQQFWRDAYIKYNGSFLKPKL